MRTPSAHCVHGRDHEDAKDQVAFSLGRYLFRVGMKGIPRRVEICLFSPVVCVCVVFFYSLIQSVSPFILHYPHFPQILRSMRGSFQIWAKGEQLKINLMYTHAVKIL